MRRAASALDTPIYPRVRRAAQQKASQHPSVVSEGRWTSTLVDAGCQEESTEAAETRLNCPEALQITLDIIGPG
ncbi:hypothetical protein AMECASPLE_032983 [Ameca splendens]|uniref:Uncharacterized protein n=1 Tax=Ameca splendens TaxID=208324 RepID=A0ABV1AEB1_9TELE